MYPKNIGCTDGRWHGSTGISPSRGSRATLPIACDASPPESRLHARAVAVRESHYPVGSRRPRENRSRFMSSCLSLAPVKIQEVVAHRPHGSLPTDRIRLPYTAGNIPPGFLCQRTRSPMRKGVRMGASGL